MRLAFVAGLAVASAATLWAARPAAAASLTPNEMIEIAYVEPRDPAFEGYYRGLQKRKVLEELRVFLSPLKLPRKITIRVEQCDELNRLYTPGEPVAICYEYIERLNELAAEIPADGSGPLGVGRDDAVVGAFVQTTLQHTASAVFDVLDVPIWGREQDAADKLAAFLMMQFGPNTARKLITGAAYFFQASERTWSGVDFSDPRGAETQRYYNYLCIAYGFDPKLFGDFFRGVSKAQVLNATLTLPPSRAWWRPKEFAAEKWAFMRLIMPYVDADKLAEVLQRDWLQPVTE